MIKYTVSDFFMIRTPIIAVDDYLCMFNDISELDIRLKEAFESDVLKEALTVASMDLLEANSKNELSVTSKSSEQLRSSLVKYFIRLSTRPTPFGLFSGISIGKFGKTSNVTVSKLHMHTKRARLDTEWLYGLIKKIESNVVIRKSLRVRFNDFTFANGDRIEKPNKTFLQLDENNTNMRELSSSIRYTAQVKMLEQKCCVYQSFSGILEDIAALNTHVPINRIESFLSQLLENEYLLSELRPPLINADMLDYLLQSLNKINNVKDVAFYIEKLKEIQQGIADYNKTPIGDGREAYNEIIRMQEALHKSKNYMQIDLKIHAESNMLDCSLRENLERFVAAICKLAPVGSKSDEMAHYTDLFLERYGYNAEIPIMELLDMDKGLGAPAHFQNNTIGRAIPKRQKTIKEQRLNKLLDRKLIIALREGKKSIDIADEDIDYVCDGDVQINASDLMDCQQSFEMYLLVHPDADYSLTLAPAMVSDGFGKSFGRFNDMLTEDELHLLKDGFGQVKSLLDDYVVVEIAELPSSGRTSNVTINNSDFDYQISLTTNPCEGKHVLSIRDLHIGVDTDSNLFYIRSKSLDKKVIVTMTSMINPMFGSNALRFLNEVSGMRKSKVTDTIANIIRHSINFEYSPRITYDKIIIKPETWIISREILGIKNEKDKDKYEESFIQYRQKWEIPRFVFLNEFDNRLLLDLDNPVHRNEIFNVIKKNTVVSVNLTEIGCEFKDFVAINDEGKKYITEIVVPFILDSDSLQKNKKDSNKDIIFKTLSNVSANRMSIERDSLTLLPGNNEWLYYKLYGCSKRQNELIAIAYEMLEKLIAEGLVQKYFFMRYADPEPHLRLRIQPSERGVLPLYATLSGWLGDLHAIGLISKAVQDSYIREAERYGGLSTIKEAEHYFYSDSKMVMQILKLHRYSEQPSAMVYIGISFVVSVLEAFALSRNEQEEFLNLLTNPKDYREVFKKDRTLIMRAVNSSDDWFDIRSSISNPEIYDWINLNAKAVKEYAKAICSVDQRGELTNSIKNIVISITHMFCNRLMGDVIWESKIYALTRHGVNGLIGFLKHSRHQSAICELPESLI